MKKVSINISLDDEKLDALVFFMAKDNTSPQKELEDSLEKLYTKYVSADTREYIESRMPTAAAKPKRPAKPAAPKPQAVEPGSAAASTVASASAKEVQ